MLVEGMQSLAGRRSDMVLILTARLEVRAQVSEKSSKGNGNSNDSSNGNFNLKQKVDLLGTRQRVDGNLYV